MSKRSSSSFSTPAPKKEFVQLTGEKTAILSSLFLAFCPRCPKKGELDAYEFGITEDGTLLHLDHASRCRFCQKFVDITGNASRVHSAYDVICVSCDVGTCDCCSRNARLCGDGRYARAPSGSGVWCSKCCKPKHMDCEHLLQGKAHDPKKTLCVYCGETSADDANMTSSNVTGGSLHEFKCTVRCHSCDQSMAKDKDNKENQSSSNRRICLLCVTMSPTCTECDESLLKLGENYWLQTDGAKLCKTCATV